MDSELGIVDISIFLTTPYKYFGRSNLFIYGS